MKSRILLILCALPFLVAFAAAPKATGNDAVVVSTDDTLSLIELVDVVIEAPAFVVDPEVVEYFAEQGLTYDSCSYYPLYEQSLSWIGVPYRYAGQTKSGTDCSSLIKNLYSEVYNLELEGTSRSLFSQCDEVAKENLQEGDLLFFKINKPQISHIALYLKDGYFVHASVRRGVMINRLSEKYYRTYFYTGGRLKEEATSPAL